LGPIARTEILCKYDYVSLNLLQCEQMFCCVRKYSLPTVASLLCIAQIEEMDRTDR